MPIGLPGDDRALIGGRSMDASALIDAYCAVWTEPDPSRRAALLQSVWAPGAT